ncbi:MAG: thioredoxin domain-containing protein [Candidatus Pacebacteria bacterium]|nr:thioredoxin domain-containing protein [Candidatus Paceibacterota bacterium]MBP9842627.1 thioredoxin domain-containing protein [Candidatus Paceibacterota bacterium]
MEPSSSNQSHPAIPLAIIIGFAMIAIAIFFTSGGSKSKLTAEDIATTTPNMTGIPRPIDASDYIKGNPNAPILIVEYSDYDCPYCKQYHTTLKQIMDEYAINGRVAWVYRQFPIQQLHPNSPKISEAALCAGSLGGNDAFWKFTDLVFEEREIDEPTNSIKLPEYAEKAGVNRSEFEACVSSGKMEEQVRNSVEDAFDIGARGTPYTVIMVGSEQAVINGAQSYETVKGILDNLIGQLDGTLNTAPPAQGVPVQ